MLLLRTDGGRLQHRLSHQQFQVERIRDSEALNRLGEGVRIKNYFTSKALVRRLPKELPVPQRNPPIRFRKSVASAIFSI